MSDNAVVGDLYVWCRPAFEKTVFDLLAWAYSGSYGVHASRVEGLTMFRLSVPAPQERGDLDVLNALVTYGAGAIVYSWFEPISQA